MSTLVKNMLGSGGSDLELLYSSSDIQSDLTFYGTANMFTGQFKIILNPYILTKWQSRYILVPKQTEYLVSDIVKVPMSPGSSMREPQSFQLVPSEFAPSEETTLPVAFYRGSSKDANMDFYLDVDGVITFPLSYNTTTDIFEQGAKQPSCFFISYE